MKFGSWCSKGQAILRNLRRFWPAMVVMSLLLLLSMGPNAIRLIEYKMECSDFADQRLQYEVFHVLATISDGLRMAFYGCLSALLLMGDSFSTRYANGLGSFPVKRANRFWVVIQSGLVMLLIPVLLSMVPFLPIPQPGWQMVLVTYLTLVVLWLVGFAAGILAATLTGTVFAAILTSLILTLGLPLLTLLAVFIAEASITGLVIPLVVVLKSPPLLAVLYHAVFLYESDIVTTNEYWAAIMISVAASLLMLVLAFFLYRKRETERTGNFLVFPKLKPVMKLLCTCMGGGLLGVILMNVLYMSEITVTPLQNLISFFPSILVARLAAEMVVEKTTRVFRKKQLLRYGFCAIVVVGLVFLTHIDPFGIETRVPEQDEVVSVKVESYQETAIFTNPEDIATVLELHREVLPYREMRESAGSTGYDDAVIGFTYQLESGKTMERYYELRLGVSVGDVVNGREDHPLLRKMIDFVNSPQWFLAQLWEKSEEADTSAEQILPRITEASIVCQMPYLKMGTVEDPEVLEALFQATLEDLENGKAWLDNTYWREDDFSYYYVGFSFYEKDDTIQVDRAGYPTRQVRVYFSEEGSAVVALIEQLAEQYGWPDPMENIG